MRAIFEVKPGGESFIEKTGFDRAHMRAHRHAARLAAERKGFYQVFRTDRTEPMGFGSDTAPALLEAKRGHAAYFDFNKVGWLPLPEEQVSVEQKQKVSA